MEQDESVLKFEQYLKRRFPERRTAQDYLSDIRQFRALRAKAWREMTMQDIDEFVDHQRQKGLKSATINRRVAALKTFIDFLAEESGDLAWPNPVRFKRHASRRGRRLPRDLSDETVAHPWQVISKPRDRAWFALMLRAGLRVGEVVSLCGADQLTPPGPEQAARLRVEGKGRKERMVLLSSDAYAVLQEWLHVPPPRESPLLFLNDRGQGLSVSGIEWQARPLDPTSPLWDLPDGKVMSQTWLQRQTKGHRPPGCHSQPSTSSPAPHLCHPSAQRRHGCHPHSEAPGPRLALHHHDLCPASRCHHRTSQHALLTHAYASLRPLRFRS